MRVRSAICVASAACALWLSSAGINEAYVSWQTSGAAGKEVDDAIWPVSFKDYDLGYIDLEQKTLQPLNNPFGLRVHPCDWNKPSPMSPLWTS